ncbi:MAG: hypothetical protein ABJP70_08760 [Erythrobacter sp.]
MGQDPDEEWRTLWKRFRKYFTDYGGRNAVLRSPFFWVAVLLSIGSFRLWHFEWTEHCRQIIPGLLGFSLGTYAILFSIIGPRLKGAMKAIKNDEGVAYLDEMNATFFHFILIQVLAIGLSFVRTASFFRDLPTFLFGKSLMIEYPSIIFNFTLGIVGTFLFFYSLFLTIAAALVVYRLSGIVEPAE